ncbi:MAG: hypothetical protein KGM42_04640 [Hyphomicrobiales bacterium]|nr:hypothetical protein [Hyphomicrobiales bacterium]
MINFGSTMPALSSRLRLMGLLQELQKEAAELGLSRTAAALEVTVAVVAEELADQTPPAAGRMSDAQAAEDDGL